MQWTEERVDLLKQYWSEGLSASEISNKLGGVTRNAVIGKAHRLGLQSRPSPIRKKIKTNTTVKSKSSKKKVAVIKSNVVSLRGNSCQWPIGDPREPGFKFCDKKSLPSKPYCLDHAMVAYQNFNGEDVKAKKSA